MYLIMVSELPNERYYPSHLSDGGSPAGKMLGVRCDVWPLRLSTVSLLSPLLGDHSRNHQLKAWCHQGAQGSPHDTQLPRKIKFCCSNSTFCWNYLMSFKCKKVRWLSSTELPLYILWITSSGAELSFLMGWRTIQNCPDFTCTFHRVI